MRSHNTMLSLLALLAALLPAGCAEQDPSLLLTGYYFASGEVDEMDETIIRNCVYKVTSGADNTPAQDVNVNLQQLIDNGQPAGGSGKNVFVFGASVENRLASSIRGSTERLDTNIITLKSAKIRYLFSSPVVFDRVFNVTIPTNNTSVFGIPLINGDGDITELKEALAAQPVAANQVVTVTAEITVSGTLLDGTDVESNILEYPINLCANCGTVLPTTSQCAPE
jgi:hypothetical protein